MVGSPYDFVSSVLLSALSHESLSSENVEMCFLVLSKDQLGPKQNQVEALPHDLFSEDAAMRLLCFQGISGVPNKTELKHYLLNLYLVKML